MLPYPGKRELVMLLETKSPFAKLGVPSVVASHWLSCERLSLAVLLPGEEKNLSSSLPG